MAATSLIQHNLTAQNAAKTQASVQAAAASSSSSSSTSDAGTISANDFLTLLVTEMQNQDPTATTDPNEYINQLVNVNSLQQLISINQTLTDAYGSNTSSSSPVSAPVAAVSASSPLAAATSTSSIAPAGNGASSSGAPVAGNLGLPAAQPSALAVARSLAGTGAQNARHIASSR